MVSFEAKVKKAMDLHEQIVEVASQVEDRAKRVLRKLQDLDKRISKV